MQSAKPSPLTPDYVRKLPFYDGTKLNLPKLKTFIGASTDEWSKIAGKSTRTLYRQKHAAPNLLKKLNPLVYGLVMLAEIAEPEEIKDWLHRPLVEWRGRTPMSELVRGNVEGVVHLVERLRAGEGGY